MADHIFNYREMGRTVSTRLAERSILRSIFPNADYRSEAKRLKLVHRLIGLWRKRLEELRGEDWTAIRGTRMQFVRNCPCSFAFGELEGDHRLLRPCQNWTICPWCWARSTAQEALSRLSDRFVDKSLPPLRLGRGVLANTIPWRMPVKKVINTFVPSQVAMIKKAIPRETLGDLRLTIVYPISNESMWRVESRFLVALPEGKTSWGRGHAASDDWKETGVIRTLGGLAREIQQYAMYPHEMMFGEVGGVAEVLKAGKPFRLRSYSGIARWS